MVMTSCLLTWGTDLSSEFVTYKRVSVEEEERGGKLFFVDNLFMF